jgi:hypothetical protein
MPARPTGFRWMIAVASAVLVMEVVGVAAPAPSGIKGKVVDASAGVLPGVTVTAQAPDGRPLATTVTNAVGEFTFDSLPSGEVTLLFHLNGFADAKATISIGPAGSSGENTAERIVQRLELSTFAESVTVRGAAPPPPPPAPRVLAAVPEHDPASVCGPAKAEDEIPAIGVIRSVRTGRPQGMFATRDELTIEPGVVSPLNVGDNFVVRRRYPTPLTDNRNRVTMGEHTAGLLQIVEADGPMATAVVIYACDEMTIGDYLAPFRPEAIRPTHPEGAPAFDGPARLLFGAAGQMLGSTNRLLVIDHGARDGVRIGQRLTIFRRSAAVPTPMMLGDAVVVAVRRTSATIRVERATDVLFLGHDGDWVAPQPPARTRKP